jgi:hypothetical protein
LKSPGADKMTSSSWQVRIMGDFEGVRVSWKGDEVKTHIRKRAALKIVHLAKVMNTKIATF